MPKNLRIDASANSTRLDRYDLFLTLACFVASLALYIRTLTPGLLPGDSGEFQTLAYLLGHTHPTGYPVYLALAGESTAVLLDPEYSAAQAVDAGIIPMNAGLVVTYGQ